MNQRKKVIGIVFTGALAVAAIFGVLTTRSVYAQAVTPTPAAPGTQAVPAQPGMGRGFRGDEMRGGMFGGSSAELASALGITTDQLQTAVTAANADALKAAVSQGLITQAQADQLSANGRGFEFRHFGGASGINYDEYLAKALNITTAQLQTARQKAYTASIDSAVANGTLTQAQADLMKAHNALANDANFQTSLQTAYETALKQAVTDGVITQAQADAILQQQQPQQPQAGGFFGRGPGGFGGRGGHGGWFEGNPQTNPTAPTTTAPTTNGL